MRIIVACIAAFCVVQFAGCEPNPAPNHSATLVSATDVNLSVRVDATFTGPANTSASVGVKLDGNDWRFSEIQVVDFDASGNASISFYPTWASGGDTIHVGVSPDGGNTVSYDTGVVD